MFAQESVMEIQKEREAFERFKAKQIGIDYETLKKDLDDCEKRFPNNRYAGWNFKSDWELWQAAKAQAVPDGYKVVPVEPKRETIKQMNKVWFESNCAHIMKTKTVELLYKAMIEAQEPAND